MKKKNRIWQAAVIIGVMLCVCGCQSDAGAVSETPENAGATLQTADKEGTDAGTDGANQENPQDDTTEESSADGYFYIVNGVTVGVDMDMDEIKDDLGESKSVFEAPSCAGEGISYIYTYASYEIETYPALDGKNRIGYIVLKDDTTATAEGIDLSMTKEDVILAYGENYEEDGNGITYVKGETKLHFIFEGDNIISIEYVSAVIG